MGMMSNSVTTSHFAGSGSFGNYVLFTPKVNPGTFNDAVSQQPLCGKAVFGKIRRNEGPGFRVLYNGESTRVAVRVYVDTPLSR